MIVIEIDEESGVSHFEVLGLTPRDLDGLDEKAQTVKVTNVAKAHRTKYQKKAQLNDKDAAAALDRINEAATVLKLSKSRKEYIEKLGQGKAGMLDVLRIEHTAPVFFWDRAARFRVIEQMLKEMGQNGNLAEDEESGISHFDEEDGISHFEVLGLTPHDLYGLDERAQTVKVVNATKALKKEIQRKAQLGDKDAEAALNRINQACIVLGHPESRKEYIEKLGHG